MAYRLIAAASIFTTIKFWAVLILFLGGFSTVGYFVHRYKTLSLENTIYSNENTVLTDGLNVCEDVSIDLEKYIAVQNQRIKDYNAQARIEIEQARARTDVMAVFVRDQLEVNDTLRLQLEAVRRETREALKDDPEFSDWSIDTVPDATWRLLRKSTEGTN
jgi:hypothetical protein